MYLVQKVEKVSEYLKNFTFNFLVETEMLNKAFVCFFKKFPKSL